MKTPPSHTHPTPHLNFPVSSNCLPPLFFQLSGFFGWMGDHATFDVLFYLMLMWIYTCRHLGTLVPKGPWCVFYATRCQVYWGLTQCGFLLLLRFDITHTNTHTGASRLTHPYNRFTLVMCSQQLPLIHQIIRWISHWY